jgi:hypothetical protein
VLCLESAVVFGEEGNVSAWLSYARKSPLWRVFWVNAQKSITSDVFGQVAGGLMGTR